MISEQDFFQKIEGYWGQLYTEEKLELFQQAQKVPENGTIVEIGALYGLSTACLALGGPQAHIISIDNWSYQPLASMIASPEENAHRLEILGINNVKFVTANSEKLETPDYPIDLLWIDAGHEYRFIYHDIFTFGPKAQTIVCHDYGFSYEGVTKAINEFIASNPIFKIDHTTVAQVIIKRQG